MHELIIILRIIISRDAILKWAITTATVTRLLKHINKYDEWLDDDRGRQWLYIYGR